MDDEDSSLVKRLVSALVIVLLISAGLKVFEDLQSNPNACQSGNQSTLDLTNLALLSFSTSTISESSQDLLNSNYWSIVDTSYGQTIEMLIPQTVVGFLQNSQAWKNWTIQNMANPPSWIDSGPISEIDQQLAGLQSEAIGSTNSGQARGYITSFASSVSGYSLAALDYVTFNGLTSLKSFFIDDVTTTRDIEYDMASKESTADVARIGAEIAYTMATEELGLKNVIMIDPSQPGPDLYTRDWSVVIEARMLQRTGNEFGGIQTKDIEHELNKMIERVQGDFEEYPTAQIGYVSFAYLDNDGSIHVIILEIPRTWGMHSVGVSS